MSLNIQSVYDPEFQKFGKVVEGYDFKELLKILDASTNAPSDQVIYVPSLKDLEATKTMHELTTNCYGGMPIQIGYCSGTNTKLNCLGYHRSSEIDIAADNMVLLLARQQDAMNKNLHTSKVEAFLCPKGTAVELYATTMHYAPCSARKGASFRAIIVLPRGTNTEKPKVIKKNFEDDRLFACNKWLLAHPESEEASKGGVVALTGENIDIYDLLPPLQ